MTDKQCTLSRIVEYGACDNTSMIFLDPDTLSPMILNLHLTALSPKIRLDLLDLPIHHQDRFTIFLPMHMNLDFSNLSSSRHDCLSHPLFYSMRVSHCHIRRYSDCQIQQSLAYLALNFPRPVVHAKQLTTGFYPSNVPYSKQFSSIYKILHHAFYRSLRLRVNSSIE